MNKIIDQFSIDKTKTKRAYDWPASDGESWSIGIYKGISPFDLKSIDEIDNPILTRYEVNDIEASFVADPFVIFVNGKYYMFMEIKNIDTKKGDVGVASSDDGLHWNYEGIVLEEPFHLSYPYVFEYEGSHYMIPETLGGDAVRLYKSNNFPYDWKHHCDLINGQHADPSIFFHDNKWWMFTCPIPFKHNTLNLYFSDSLFGPWIPHPKNPLIENDPAHARPAGRVFFYDGHWIRLAQDCSQVYGRQVNAFKIQKLNTSDYQEEAYVGNPILKNTDEGWNGRGMHHIDPFLCQDGFWLACVDGYFLNEEEEK